MRPITHLACTTILTVLPMAALAQIAATDLKAELASLDARIANAEASVQSYQGGLLSDVATLTLETLRLTRAALEAQAEIDEVGFEPKQDLSIGAPNPELADEILQEIVAQERLVKETRAEAQGTGGLIQAMVLTRLETERLKLATLQGSWLRARYGVISPILIPSADRTSPPVTVSRPSDVPNSDNMQSTVEWADPDHPEIDYEAEPFLSYARQGFRMSGWWAIRETRAAIDDSPKVLAINSSAMDTKSFGNKRRLMVQCTEGVASIIYDADTYLPSDYRSTSYKTTWRLDNDPAVEDSWSILDGNQGSGLFDIRGERMMRSIYNGDQLFLRIFDNNGSSQDALFNLAGSAEAYDAVAAACGFSTLDLSEDDYLAIQTALNAGGFDAGIPDGQWGAGSRAAMKRYQEVEGLNATGAPDRETLTRMGLGQ